MGSNIARKWRELSGQNKWKGLLDPLDIDLRRYIIHYGQLVQASYDAFISERASRYAGNCRYDERDLFSKVGLEKGNPFKYAVTKYLYATSRASDWEKFILKSLAKSEVGLESNWMGYVAVATDEGKAALGRRDIVVAWRGTIQGSEWVKNFHFHMDTAPLIFGDSSPAEIHNGFYSLYTSDNPASHLAASSARTQVIN